MRKILISQLLTGIAGLATFVAFIFDIINYIKADAFPILFILPLIATIIGIYNTYRIVSKKADNFIKDFKEEDKFFKNFD